MKFFSILGEEVLSDEMGSPNDSYFAQFLPRTHGNDSTWVETLSENILSLGKEAWQYQAGGNGNISKHL